MGKVMLLKFCICGTYPISLKLVIEFISFSKSFIVPLSAFNWPSINFKSVDFPEPFSPDIDIS